MLDIQKENSIPFVQRRRVTMRHVRDCGSLWRLGDIRKARYKERRIEYYVIQNKRS